jgi:hypothetical protein
MKVLFIANILRKEDVRFSWGWFEYNVSENFTPSQTVVK